MKLQSDTARRAATLVTLVLTLVWTSSAMAQSSRSSRPLRSPPAPESGTGAAAREGDTTEAESAAPAAGKRKGALGRVIEFVIEYKIVIVVILVGGLLVSLAFLFFTGRASDTAEDDEDTIEILPVGRRRDEDDDGPRRVLIDPETGKPRDMPTRAESEYALVVEEDVLHHDTPSGELEAAVVAVQALIERQDFKAAYDKYRERVEAHGHRAFHPGLERRLAKYFLSRKDYRRAAEILEHHLETQPDGEIEPESYFDLGYVHFKTRTLKKSRDCFQAFAERERNPAFSARARKLIAEIDAKSSAS